MMVREDEESSPGGFLMRSVVALLLEPPRTRTASNLRGRRGQPQRRRIRPPVWDQERVDVRGIDDAADKRIWNRRSLRT